MVIKVDKSDEFVKKGYKLISEYGSTTSMYKSREKKISRSTVTSV